MGRLISILLILAGLGIVAIGAMAWMTPPPPEVTEAPEQASVSPPEMAESFNGSRMVGIESLTGQSLGDRLRRVPIAHETPETGRIGQPFDVTLSLDATGDDDPVRALPGLGNIIEGEAQVTEDVQATLIGSAFEIEALSPEVQALSPLTPNTWRWKVTPLVSGPQDLILEIFALDGARTLPVRSFRDTVTVEVTTLRQAINLAQNANPLFVVLGGIGSVLGGVVGALRLFKFKG